MSNIFPNSDFFGLPCIFHYPWKLFIACPLISGLETDACWSIGVKHLISTFCGHFWSLTLLKSFPSGLWPFKVSSLATLFCGLDLMFNPFLCIRITRAGGGLSKQNRFHGLTPRIPNSVGQVRPKNLHFKQVPRWCWWSRNHVLRYTVLVPSLFSPVIVKCLFKKSYCVYPSCF